MPQLVLTRCVSVRGRLSLVHEYHGLTYLTEVLDLLLTTSLASSSTDDSTVRSGRQRLPVEHVAFPERFLDNMLEYPFFGK